MAENKGWNVVIGSIVGVLLVGIFILAVSVGINIAVTPLGAALKDTGKVSAQVDALASRISSLEADIKAVRKELAERPQPQAMPPDEPPSEDFNKVYDIPVAGSYILGNPNARVTIVEFSDFQCPFCARFHPMVTEAHNTFPNDVRVILKNFPLGFHPNARPAAKAALAAGLQGKYFEMVELLLANGNALSDEKYKELAGKVGINVERFVKDLKDRDAEFEKQIETDMGIAGQADVRGTPTYFLNGKKTVARTPEALKSEIQALLK